MPCKSDYLAQSPEEKAMQNAYKELHKLIEVALPLAAELSSNQYATSMPITTILDELTRFNCKAIELLDSRGILANPLVRQWREEHMEADLNRAEALRKEAAEIMKRYGK